MSAPKDLIPGVVILIVVAALYYVTTTFEEDPLGMAQGMPATHMPQLILTTIAVLALLMIGQGIRKAEEAKEPIPMKMPITAGLLFAAALGFEPVGVPLVFFAICIILPLLWGARNFLLIGIFSVAMPTAILVVFQGLLGLRLPLGPLAGLI